MWEFALDRVNLFKYNWRRGNQAAYTTKNLELPLAQNHKKFQIATCALARVTQKISDCHFCTGALTLTGVSEHSLTSKDPVT